MMIFQSQMGTRPEVSLLSAHRIHWLPGQLMAPSHSHHPQTVAPPLLPPRSFCLLGLFPTPSLLSEGSVLFSLPPAWRPTCVALKRRGFHLLPCRRWGPSREDDGNGGSLGQGSFPSCQVAPLYRVSLLSGLFFNLSSLQLSPLCILGFLGALLGLQFPTILILVHGILSTSIPGSFPRPAKRKALLPFILRSGGHSQPMPSCLWLSPLPLVSVS